MEIMKALGISVYKHPLYKGCSNGGITERFDELLLISEEGYIDIDENNPPENLVKLVTRNIMGKEYKHIEPYKKAHGLGWMAGGSIASSSDSRFPNIYPLAIHDRTESQEEYNFYSH